MSSPKRKTKSGVRREGANAIFGSGCGEVPWSVGGDSGLSPTNLGYPCRPTILASHVRRPDSGFLQIPNPDGAPSGAIRKDDGRQFILAKKGLEDIGGPGELGEMLDSISDLLEILGGDVSLSLDHPSWMPALTGAAALFTTGSFAYPSLPGVIFNI